MQSVTSKPKYYTILLASIFVLAIFFPTKSYAAVLRRPPNNLGLVGYWAMDEGVGSKAGDSSGFSNNGTITGATWADGKRGKALDFNGTSNYINAGSGSSLDIPGAVTICSWVYARSVPNASEGVIVSNSSSDFSKIQNNLEIEVDRRVGMFWINGGVFSILSTGAAINFNEWAHVCVSRVNSTTGTVYANGSAVATSINSGTIPTSGFGNTNIGRQGDGDGSYFDGKIDDVRIYNRALSAADILALYKSGQVKLIAIKKSATFVQSTSNNAGNADTNTVTLTNPVVSGNLMIVRLLWGDNSNIITVNSVTDNKGNTYYAACSRQNKDIGGGIFYSQAIYYAKNVVGGSNFQITAVLSSAAQNSNFSNRGSEFSGVDRDNPFDGCAKSEGTDDTNYISTAPITTTRGGGVLFASSVDDGADLVLNGNWVTIAGGNGRGYLLTTMPGTYYVTHTSDGIHKWQVINAAFKAATGVKVNSSQNSRLTNGLVGLWSFNGGDMTPTVAYDRSGNGNNGTITGATPIIGKVGQAVSLDGVDDYIDMGTSGTLAMTGSITLFQWVKSTDSLTGVKLMMGNWNADDRFNYGFFWNDSGGTNDLSFIVGTGVINAHTTNIWNDGNWHLFTATWDGSTATLYVDGVYITSNSGATTVSNPSDSWWIGKFTTGSYYFKATIDEARLYNRALPADEVKQLYLMGR